MLVLSRKESESIMIGDDIQVTVERIEGSKVRISVSAPREVLILRSEVQRKGEQDGVAEPD